MNHLYHREGNKQKKHEHLKLTMKSVVTLSMLSVITANTQTFRNSQWQPYINTSWFGEVHLKKCTVKRKHVIVSEYKGTFPWGSAHHKASHHYSTWVSLLFFYWSEWKWQQLVVQMGKVNQSKATYRFRICGYFTWVSSVTLCMACRCCLWPNKSRNQKVLKQPHGSLLFCGSTFK